jgi:formylglycine-generating enzyme
MGKRGTQSQGDGSRSAFFRADQEPYYSTASTKNVEMGPYPKRVSPPLATALALALFVCAPAALAQPLAPRPRPVPRHRRPPPPPTLPVVEATTSEGTVTLKAPAPDAILIRSGTFTMGSSAAEIAQILTTDEETLAESLGICPSALDRRLDNRTCVEHLFGFEYEPRQVFLSDFWIDRTEVTVGRYRQCVAAGRCREPPYAAGGKRFDRPDFPVVLVTWSDADTFCTWAGGRLPTEAEWERAARGLAGRRYPWGNVYNPTLSNHGKLAYDEIDADDGFAELAPVGSYPDGRTPDGIADLAGNVEEWVADWFQDYPKTSESNPRGPSTGDTRVLRGGHYGDSRAFLRAAARGHDLQSARRPYRGFRCARSP